MSVEQKQAAFAGLTLATTREEMLFAVIDTLAKSSAARLQLLLLRAAPPSAIASSSAVEPRAA